MDAEMILPEAEHELDAGSSIASSSSGDDENSAIIYLVSSFFICYINLSHFSAVGLNHFI